MKNEEILEQAKKNYKACEDYYGTLYEDCVEDWEFAHGVNQWEAQALRDRKTDGRPTLTLNQMLPYLNQVVNDIKQARLAIRVTPVDSNADVDTAEVLAGIIRNIESQSGAKSVYGTAASNAVGAGIGWIRVLTDWADESSFDQEAKIERVLDFTSVMLDPSFKEVDGRDADYGFVKLSYTKEQFEDMYPNAEASPFCDDGSEDVSLVEYFYKEKKKTQLHSIRLLDGQERNVSDDQLKQIDEQEIVYELVRSREVDLVNVYHCVLSGSEVLSREIFPSKFIPLVPVIGNEVYINDQREFHSLIRQGKDAQRMFNYWKSASTEMIALQPKAPWVGAFGSFESEEDKWASSNNQNHPFLQYDVVPDPITGMALPPPTRLPPVQGSPALFQEAMAAKEDIRLAIGMPQSNMGERSNAVSGVAIRNQQVEGDNATYHFIDNLSSSIAQVGRILNSIIPVIYSDRKIARIIGEDQKEEIIPVNTPFVKENGVKRAARQGEEWQGVYDLQSGKYDVVMDVGASYSSKRQEAADKLIELIRAKPDLTDIAGDMLFEALDIPLGREIADRIRATMSPELLGEDPQAVKLQQASQMLQEMEQRIQNYEAALADKKKNQDFDNMVELKKLELEQQDLQIKAQKTAAEIEKMRAETTGYNMEAMAALGNAMTAMNERVSDIGTALEIILDAKEDEEGEGIEPIESMPIPTEEIS